MRLPQPSRPKPVPAIAEPELVLASFLSRRAFLSQLAVGSEACTFVVPEATALKAGAFVRVKLSFLDQVVVFELAGQVLRCEPRGGAVIEVTGPELRSFARAYAFARGLPLAWGRRSSERIEVSLPGEVATAGKELVRCAVQDLSRGGARVVLPAARLHEGDPVRFTIRLGLLRRVRGTGSVAWTARRPDGLSAGIEFGALETADRLSLSSFLLERRGAK